MAAALLLGVAASCLGGAAAQAPVQFNSTFALEFCGHDNESCPPVTPGEFFLAVGPFVLIPYLLCCGLATYGCYFENQTAIDSALASVQVPEWGTGGGNAGRGRGNGGGAADGGIEMPAAAGTPGARRASRNNGRTSPEPEPDMDSSASDGSTSSRVGSGGAVSVTVRPNRGARRRGSSGDSSITSEMGDAAAGSGGGGGDAQGQYVRGGADGPGAFSFSDGLVAAVGSSDDEAVPLFQLRDGNATLAARANGTDAAVMAAMAPNLPETGPWDFYLVADRGTTGVILVLPVAEIGAAFERVWTGAVAANKNLVSVARSAVNLDGRKHVLMWASIGMARAGAGSGGPKAVPLDRGKWGAAAGEACTVGFQVDSEGQAHFVRDGRRAGSVAFAGAGGVAMGVLVLLQRGGRIEAFSNAGGIDTMRGADRGFRAAMRAALQ